MLVSPKWQTMWVESQYCSKNNVNLTLPTQTQKILQDLVMSCNSSNKAVQLEALKCWETWINSQNQDDWKLNTVCYTAIRPLIAKKLQPFHKDVDVCKLKLSLMWTLLVKVENMMHLEGPQYILEVFLQSCLTWLSSADGVDNEIFILIFQLLLALLKNNVNLFKCNQDMFPPLSTEILGSKKVFQRLADKFLNVFVNWNKVGDKSVIVTIWKCFLEHCERSCEHIPIPIWHKVFKIAAQICSETNEPLKERLRFLHGCATTLKSVLSSSKFIDFGNLLTTPCEALLKKLIDLCTVDCEEFCDLEMFRLSQEISQVLSNESVAFGGFDLCIFVLNRLEDFFLKSLFWGVWCGLVDCYRTRLKGLEKNQFTKTQVKFFRKLRGVAVNFDLDRSYLHADCIAEVERHIELLEIGCLCGNSRSFCRVQPRHQQSEELSVDCSQVMEVDTGNENVDRRSFSDPRSQNNKIVPNGLLDRRLVLTQESSFGKFSTVDLHRRRKPLEVISFKFDFIRDVLRAVDTYAIKSLFEGLFWGPFIKPKDCQNNELVFNKFSTRLDPSVGHSKQIKLEVTSCKNGARPPVSCEVHTKNNAVVLVSPKRRDGKAYVEKVVEEKETISTPVTRSKRRAEEIKKEMEGYQTRKKRKSFEVVVQEMVKKNKIRKTETNCVKEKKSSVSVSKKQKPKNSGDSSKREVKSEAKTKKVENCKEKSRKEEPRQNHKKKKGHKLFKTRGKLENYFKIIGKSTRENKKKEKEDCKSLKEKDKKENKTSNSGEKKESEIGWKLTSLKSMMNRKSKSKEGKAEHGMETRNRRSGESENAKGKQKVTNEKKAVSRKPSIDSSPFKEILHDHEYAKVLEPSSLGGRECDLANDLKETAQREGNSSPEARQEDKSENDFDITEVVPESAIKEEVLCNEKSVSLVKEENDFITQSVSRRKEDCIKNKLEAIKKAECLEDALASAGEEGKSTVDESASLEEEIKNILNESVSATEERLGEKLPVPVVERVQDFENECNSIVEEDEESKEPVKEDEKNSKTHFEKSKNDVITLNQLEDKILESDVILIRRGKKRMRMMDSLKPSKKMRLDTYEDSNEDDLTCLELIEKENFEIIPAENNAKVVVVGTPTKEVVGDKLIVKDDVSPNGNSKIRQAGDETISSRALRMIALVPESTKPGQAHRDSPSAKTEAKAQIKKAPNVDKNSRASKMLALLHDNVSKEVVELVEGDDAKAEEFISRGSWQQVSTPNDQSLTPSLKSPNSTKKRRSIRFDDAKNETVVYDIDTPPSKIHNSKRSKLEEIVLMLT